MTLLLSLPQAGQTQMGHMTNSYHCHHYQIRFFLSQAGQTQRGPLTNSYHCHDFNFPYFRYHYFRYYHRLVRHRGGLRPAHLQRLAAPPSEGEAHLHQGAHNDDCMIMMFTVIIVIMLRNMILVYIDANIK